MRTAISIILLTILFIGCSERKVNTKLEKSKTAMIFSDTIIVTTNDSAIRILSLVDKFKVHDTIYIDTCGTKVTNIGSSKGDIIIGN